MSLGIIAGFVLFWLGSSSRLPAGGHRCDADAPDAVWNRPLTFAFRSGAPTVGDRANLSTNTSAEPPPSSILVRCTICNAAVQNQGWSGLPDGVTYRHGISSGSTSSQRLTNWSAVISSRSSTTYMTPAAPPPAAGVVLSIPWSCEHFSATNVRHGLCSCPQRAEQRRPVDALLAAWEVGSRVSFTTWLTPSEE